MFRVIMHALASGLRPPALACSKREEDLGGAPLVGAIGGPLKWKGEVEDLVQRPL